MGILIWLVLGGIIGWIASLIMRTDAQQGLFLNIVVGIVGALIGGWLGGLFGLGGDINDGDFSISGLLMSLVGAIVLLAIVNLFRRGRVR
ncbi:GlsB/YeaQ/YmgE family stress response membrane protein [Lysobacter sp. LF1]|uniref:GlsB/YeaQ/YmgE family stress response membrane protein n=1 Tax=Lysobacter stagni TaxID=3045172 RepID=A0ABT6XDL5_9GAMM|nr:GlsB/YeaQ/YmgE family stress response membrane protein [Lysobacter sp. LF1]MDI9238240.1 GlsB/YeaQ/YmgE family stress response membrane protein [Lysobacter sp. LF1]